MTLQPAMKKPYGPDASLPFILPGPAMRAGTTNPGSLPTFWE